MKTYYKDGVFYSEASHGTKKLTIPDPEWVCPTKTIELMPGEAVWSASGELVRNEHTTFTTDDTDEIDEIEIVVIDVVVRDKTATQPTIEIDNPDCMIPPDAIEISEELHMSLLVAEAEGKIIKSDENGLPVTVDPPPPSDTQLADLAKNKRDKLIADVDWRYARHDREKRLGLRPTDDILALDKYVQALADISSQSGFPTNIIWPELA